jgi:hypothetical protein
MGYVQGRRTFAVTDYADAEKFCDGWAGDNEAHVAVVEDFDNNILIVTSYTNALEHAGRWEIQYDADYRPADQRERDAQG